MPAGLPLELNAQNVDDVAARQDIVEVVGDLAAEFVQGLGDERRRTAEDDVRSEFR